jgi:hypothetical protein
MPRASGAAKRDPARVACLCAASSTVTRAAPKKATAVKAPDLGIVVNGRQ